MTEAYDELIFLNAGATRYLGNPDWYTVSNRKSADRIIVFLDSLSDTQTYPIVW